MVFKFPETVEDVSLIPADFRPLYDDSGNRHEWAASVAKAFVGQGAALEKQRNENKTLRSKKVDLSALAEYGDTPESILESFNAKSAEYQQELAKGKDAKLNLDKLKSDMTASHTALMEAANSKTEAYKAQLYKELVENAATQAIAKAKGTPKLLLPFVKKSVKIVEREDGQLAPVVVDDQGDRRFNGLGAAMSISELVTEMKGDPEYGRLFDSDTPSGGGARRSAAIQQTNKTGDQTSTDKISEGLSTGARRFGAGQVA